MRKLYWYLSSYTRKHGLVLAISIVVAVIAFSFSITYIVRTFEQKKRTYIGMVGDYTLTALPREVQNLVSSGLTSVTEDGSVVPEVAERWQVEDDGKTYRFLIKKNLYWQDGKNVTPADITYQLKDVEIITTPNDVIFKLPESYVPFPTIVSEPLFRPSTQRQLFFFNQPTVIGIGKYSVESYKQKGPRLTEIVLDSTEERRIYRFYLSEEDAVIAFKRGEVDRLLDMTAAYGLDQWPSVDAGKTLQTARYLAVFFNMTDPLLSNKNVRQALAYAAQKPTDQTRAIGPINPQSWAYLSGGKTYEFDMDRAVERLLSEPPGEPIILELTTTPTFASEAEQLKQQFEELGKQAQTSCNSNTAIKDKTTCNNSVITINLKITSFPQTDNFQLLLIGQESPTDPDQYPLWHSDQAANFSKYKNTRIDSLLERGRQTLDRTERLAIYQEFQQFFLEDAPAVFLYHLSNYDIKRK